jgi:HDOD domain
MDCVGELATIENRLGRAGGPLALRDSGLCPPDFPILGLPILTRSAALLTLLLQDGTVDLELTSSVVALDPALAFGSLQLANLERNGQGGIWQLPLAVVAAGCDRLLAMVNGALKVETNYDCATSERFRQLYLRCVQRACIAELLTNHLGSANPKRSYLAALLFGLPGMSSSAGPRIPALSVAVGAPWQGSLPESALWEVGSSAMAAGKRTPMAASVLLAAAVLELPNSDSAEACKHTQQLADSALWQSWSDPMDERRQLLRQGCKVAKWAAANAPRLSPWEFLARLHRHKSWE